MQLRLTSLYRKLLAEYAALATGRGSKPEDEMKSMHGFRAFSEGILQHLS